MNLINKILKFKKRQQYLKINNGFSVTFELHKKIKTELMWNFSPVQDLNYKISQ